jgi:hypothetical protein
MTRLQSFFGEFRASILAYMILLHVTLAGYIGCFDKDPLPFIFKWAAVLGLLGSFIMFFYLLVSFLFYES